ncbi:6-phosphogluconolactonase [Aphelenchoides avenae]|nr:6-phosphogluconolactonase [Aphelenchus avenae]
MSTPFVEVAKTPEELQYKVRTFLETVLKASSTGNVIVGVSGGSMPTVLGPILRGLPKSDLDRIRLFAVDERLVPLDDPESNTGAYLKELPEDFRKQVAFVEHIEDAQKCADDFEQKLRAWKPPLNLNGGFPVLDVLFLGIGPDGHTCSLFPGHPLLKEDKRWIAPIEDSPKPPPRRVTVTLPVLNHARHVAFITTGESKAKVFKEIIVDNNQAYPATLVQPKLSGVHWFIDEAAAKLYSDI